MEERINLEDNIKTMIMKMADGFPGAAIVLLEFIKKNKEIDPDSALGEIGAILQLDSFGIYGSDIYILNNDVCGGDVVKSIAVLRACQLGFVSREILKDACSRQDRTGKTVVDANDLYRQVKEKLPNFDSQINSEEK